MTNLQVGMSVTMPSPSALRFGTARWIGTIVCIGAGRVQIRPHRATGHLPPLWWGEGEVEEYQ